jgi:hypothetical protein
MDRTQPDARLLFDATVISAPMGLDVHTIHSLLESLADQALRRDRKREALLEGSAEERRAMILAGIATWRDRVNALAEAFIAGDRARAERVRAGLEETAALAVMKEDRKRRALARRHGYRLEDE